MSGRGSLREARRLIDQGREIEQLLIDKEFLHGAPGVVRALTDEVERLTRFPRVTHGRHCTCSACAREDWALIKAPCGMHGSDCPGVYAPIGAPGTVLRDD